MRTNRWARLLGLLVIGGGLTTVAGCHKQEAPTEPDSGVDSRLGRDRGPVYGDDDDEPAEGGEAKTLYVWAGDDARETADFLAVVDFDRGSRTYGKILRTVPVPPPGNKGNEPHHCNLSKDKKILACGGLLSLLWSQNDIFFFDVSRARHPRFLFSTRAAHSAITDDFLPMPDGGFLITNMGSAIGGPGGRVVEVSRDLRIVGEYPGVDPEDGTFNPHGIDADFARNRLVTSDFVNPLSTLNVFAQPVELRSGVRFWDLSRRQIVRTVMLPDNAGTMDVKLIPNDPRGRAVTANMFTGLVYTVDPTTGTYVQSFDCEDIVPHVEVATPGGMVQLLAMPRNGRRLIFASFQAGQVGMLDITDRERFKQVSVVSLGENAGPHLIRLTDDDKRLVVTDYFLHEDDFGKIHFNGDHKLHVIDVGENTLEEDPRFPAIDFNSAFARPARPHGVAMK